MIIKEYKFGSITINGKDYAYDVEVCWTGEVLDWWRNESHIIDLPDIQRALEQKPDLIIIGTGAYGLAKITEKAKQAIKEQRIELIIDKTEEAVRTFNIIKQNSKEEEGKQKKVIGLFHLTC